MFFNFIGLTLFFGIGILVANGAKIVANKGKKSKGDHSINGDGIALVRYLFICDFAK